MRKQEYMEAFSNVHAPQALKQQLLQPKLRPNYTRKFAVLAACAVVASLLGIVLMGSATEAPPKTTDISIDWNMYAQLIRVEDDTIEVLDRFEMGVDGKFYAPDPDDGIIRIDLRFEMPEDFPLDLTPPDHQLELDTKPLDNQGEHWRLRNRNIYKIIDDSENVIENSPIPLDYYCTLFTSKAPIKNHVGISLRTDLAICVLEEYIVMCWDEGEPIYLVATSSPSSDPATVMNYFSSFLKYGCASDKSFTLRLEEAMQRINEEYRIQRENLDAQVKAGDKDAIDGYQSIMQYYHLRERELIAQFEKLLQVGIWGKYSK